MAIAFDAQSIGSASTGSTVTVAHTCSGSNRVLVCVISNGTEEDIVSVEYDGVAMALVESGSAGGGFESFVYVLGDPSSGSNNLVVTMSGGIDTGTCRVGGASFNGAGDIDPINVSEKTNSVSDKNINLSVTTTVDDCMLFDFLLLSAGSGTIGAGQTLVHSSESGAFLKSSYKKVGAAGSHTMTWDTTGGVGDTGLYTVIAINPRIVEATVSEDLTMTDDVEIRREREITISETMNMTDVIETSVLTRIWRNLAKNIVSVVNKNKNG